MSSILGRVFNKPVNLSNSFEDVILNVENSFFVVLEFLDFFFFFF